MLESNFEQFLQAIALVALAVMTIFIGVQKVIKNWQTTEAETSVITLMHSELERMSDQNTKLSTELGRLHSEVISLNTALQQLTVENQRLQAEIYALTQEVSKFKQVSAEQKGRGYGTSKA